MVALSVAAGSEPTLAGETGYRIAYDYPGHSSGWYGHGTLSESWQDFGSLSLIPTQQGVDFSTSYLAEAVGFYQGPPVERTRNAHTLYEFRYGLASSCLQGVTYPCSADLFRDRFEAP